MSTYGGAVVVSGTIRTNGGAKAYGVLLSFLDSSLFHDNSASRAANFDRPEQLRRRGTNGGAMVVSGTTRPVWSRWEQQRRDSIKDQNDYIIKGPCFLLQHAMTSQDKLLRYVFPVYCIMSTFFVMGYLFAQFSIHWISPLHVSLPSPYSLHSPFLYLVSYVFRALLMGVMSPPFPSLILCLLRRDPDTHSDIQINFVKILVLIPLFVLFLLSCLCLLFGIFMYLFRFCLSLILPPDGGVL